MYNTMICLTCGIPYVYNFVPWDSPYKSGRSSAADSGYGRGGCNPGGEIFLLFSFFVWERERESRMMIPSRD